MKLFYLLLFLSSLLFGQTSISEAEKSTLLSLYNKTDGANWTTTWDLSREPQYWYGIKIKNGSVTEITLNGNHLKGTLPNLAALNKLRKLDLSENRIDGDISSLSQLTYLESLNLTGNILQGNLNSLVPSLPNLTELGAGNNQFTIPDMGGFFSSAKNLTYLDLSGLHIKSIPAGISSLKKLNELHLRSDSLSAGFGNIAALTQLKILDLAENQLTEIPQPLVSLSSLIQLDLSGNLLTENKLSRLASFKDLEWLSLRNNRLTAIPTENNQLLQLVHLDLGDNQITGSISNLASLKNLQQIWLDNNKLSGSFPDTNSFPKLMMLSVAGNNLTGKLPSKLPPILDISNNRFAPADIKNYIDQLHLSGEKYTAITYSPQRYDSEKSVTASIGGEASLPQSLSATDGYEFSWFKNLELNTGITSENYSIQNVKKEDYTQYTCEAYLLTVFRSNVFEISLFREPVTLTESLSADETLPTSASIFPNPTSDFINVRTQNLKTEKILIHDGSGRLVYKGTENQINVSSFPQGLYIITVFTVEGSTKSFKFIKK